MAKKIVLEFDIDSKDVKIAGEDTLALTQQLRIFKKELQKGDLGQAEFEILRKKIGDTEDSISKTTVKSRDFFSVLSTLPGPIGTIGSSISGVVDQFKVFSSFSFKDIKNSLSDVVDDFGDILSNIGKATGITKLYTSLNNSLAASFVKVGVGEQAAAAGARAFSAALIATGIGALIVLLGLASSALYELVTGEEKAKESLEKTNKEIENQNNLLELNKKALGRRNAEMLAEMKAQGKSESEIRKEQIKQSYKDYSNAYDDEVEARNRFNSKISSASAEELKVLQTDLDKKEQLTKDYYSKYRIEVSNNISATNAEEKSAREKSLQEQKVYQEKYAQDLITANTKLRSLQQENSLLIIEDERKRGLVQLEIQKKNEIDSINQLKITREKRNELLAEVDKNFRIKSIQLNKKFDDEDLKSKQEFNQKIQDLAISLVKDNTERQIKEREIQLERELSDLRKTAEFKKKTLLQQYVIENGYRQKAEDDITKIQEEAQKERLDLSNKDFDELVSIYSDLITRQENILRQSQSNILGLTDTLSSYFGGALDNLTDYLDTFNIELYKNLDVKSLKEFYNNFYEETRKTINASLDEVKKLYENKLISETEYNDRSVKLAQQNYQNQSLYTSRLINLDNILLDARRTNSDATIEIFANLTSLLSEIAGENIKTQKAAAILEGLVSIARIIIDTQRANVAFAASVAPLGPAGVPLAAAYSVKSTISAGLAIATITAQGINKIKGIDANAAKSAGGAGGNGMGRGYEEGGLIGGKRHSQGGTMIEAERGEAIMTRGAVTMFAPMLSMMNQMGGGVSFSSNLSTARNDNPTLTNPAQEQTPLIVKTYVVENELTSTQQRQARLKDLSTL